MSLSADFDQAVSLAAQGHFQNPKRRLPPFSIRLSEQDRARLAIEAAGAPLGSYIKSKILGSAVEGRKRRKGQAIEDREALAQALALLGRSHIASNLNQIARGVNIGTWPVTPETEEEILSALRTIREIRTLLMRALGFKDGARP
jgi:hypothetical protein